MFVQFNGAGLSEDSMEIDYEMKSDGELKVMSSPSGFILVAKLSSSEYLIHRHIPKIA